MILLSQILGYSLPFLYLGVLYIYYLAFTGENKNIARKSTLFLGILVVIHAVEIISRHLALKTIPMSTVHDALCFLAFSIITVYLYIEITVKNRGSGLFIIGLALIFEIASTLKLSWEPETNELLSSPLFAVHASLAIMGYTALALSAVYGAMYLVQNNNLKRRNLGKLFMQLPAVTFLEKMSAKSVVIGIVLLGSGLLFGHLQALQVLGTFWPADPKVIISDLVLLIYIIGYLWVQRMGRKRDLMAYFAIASFLLLILGGLLVMYISESFHEFY
jgi:ABC-type transport system involved in cytochrome c biogenesis permease subunit